MRASSNKTRVCLATVAGIAASVCCAVALTATPAHAATIDELQAKVDEASQAYNDATQKVSELQSKIEESQAKIDEVNAKLPEQKEKAATSMSAAYKMQQSTPGLVSMLLSAETFSDFLTNFQYVTAIQRSNAQAVNELVTMEQELSNAQATLDAAQEEATAQQQQAESSLASAEGALNELNAQLAAEAAAQAAAQAAEEAAAQAEAASTDDSASSSGGTPVETSAATSNPSATDGTEVVTDGGWMMGSASAYCVESNTGGDATASGEILTDDSVTVAVPLDQRYLLGRSVQIRYAGTTITATVTDVGGFAKYGRVLDLAGGVWKAFGFSSADDWGVRVVQYRFL
jgi:peptidoglycan DL-endopeptidase CwlO